MLELVDPDPRYHVSWLEAEAEFADSGDYGHGSGLIPPQMADEDVSGPVWRREQMADAARFTAYCQDMRRRRDPGHVPPGLVPDTKLWMVDGEEFLGYLSLRHELNDHLRREGGHIGYSVRPSARRRGLATQALRQALDRARDLGLDRVLVTCNDDNVPSARTIERNGGVLEDISSGKRRYWIELTEPRD